MPGSSEQLKLAPSLIDAEGDKGLVYFYREARFAGGAISYYIYDNNDMIGASWSGCYFPYYASPGQHTFWGETEAKRYFTVNIEAGKTYYVEAGFGVGMWIGVPALTLVHESIAVPIIQQIDRCELKRVYPGSARH